MVNFLETYLSWINIEQLNILGVRLEYFYFIVMFITVLILYALTKPLLVWLIRKNFVIIISYLVSSLIVLIMTYTFLFVINDINIIFIKYVVYAIILFGICLSILLTYNRFKKEI